MTNRRYERTLIMLKPDTSGYSFENKEPSGHSTIEIRSGKARLITYVQSLAPLRKHQIYRVYLIAADNSTALAVSCGAIPIGESAKAESRWEFDPDNVGGSGKAIERFNIVAVLVRDVNIGAGGLTRDIIAPLVGYVDTPRVWKNLFTIFDASQVKVREVEQQAVGDSVSMDAATDTVAGVSINTATDTVTDTSTDTETDAVAVASADTATDTVTDASTDTVTDAVAVVSADTAIDTVTDASTDAVAVASADTATDTVTDASTGADTDTVAVASADTATDTVTRASTGADTGTVERPPEYRFIKSPEVETRAHIANDKPHKPTEGILEISQGNPEMTPFIEQNTEQRWVRVSLPDLAALPIDFWKYSNNAFMLSCYRKYRHYILGTHDLGHVFGVPCVYSSGQRQLALRLGFTRFQCCSGYPPRDGEYGYWLMDIRGVSKL